MTTPATSQQQRKQPPPATVPPQTLAAMVLPLAGLLLTAVSAAAVIAALKLRFKLAALFWAAMLMILLIVLAFPPPVTGTVGPASERVAQLNAVRRAQYVISATMRVLRAMMEARARGEGVTRAGEAQVERERRYYSAHLAAMWNRAVAAGKTDMAALEYGNLLSWNAILDNRTSPECRSANGKNYLASRMPDIGYPGSVHPHCRCFPGPARPGAPMLEGGYTFGYGKRAA